MEYNDVERICEKHNNPFYCITCSRRDNPLPPYITDCKEEGHEFGRFDGDQFPDFSLRVLPGVMFLVGVSETYYISLRYDVIPFRVTWTIRFETMGGEISQFNFSSIDSAIEFAESWKNKCHIWIDPREDIL